MSMHHVDDGRANLLVIEKEFLECKTAEAAWRLDDDYPLVIFNVHAFLWWASANKRLSSRARRVIIQADPSGCSS